MEEIKQKDMDSSVDAKQAFILQTEPIFKSNFTLIREIENKNILMILKKDGKICFYDIKNIENLGEINTNFKDE